MKTRPQGLLRIRFLACIIFDCSLSILNPLQAQSFVGFDRAVRQVAKSDDMRYATLSVCVYSSEGRVYGYDDERAVTPASAQKLLTTGAGFALLGSDYRFTTRLAMRGEVDRDGVLHGDLYILGGGDPLLGSYRYRQTTSDTLFGQWTRALRGRGVSRVDGSVCYHTRIFDDSPLHDSWQWGDVGNYYGAGAYGLNFHENMYFVHFNPGSMVGDSARVNRTNPRFLDLRETCRVTTGPAGSGDNVIVYGAPESPWRLYQGTVPLGRNDFGVRAALPNPPRTCADLFATHLRTKGISVSHSAREVAALPDSLRTVMDFSSTPYSTLADYTNHTSNNIYAESIFKYLGYSQKGVGNFATGTQVVTDWLATLGLQPDGLRIVDGSGLSRLNRLTADFLAHYLAVLVDQPFYPAFLASLPKAGVSGTARTIPAPPAGYSMYVKTGSMDGVKSYVGYLVADDGRWLAFALISNGHSCSTNQAAKLLMPLLGEMAKEM